MRFVSTMVALALLGSACGEDQAKNVKTTKVTVKMQSIDSDASLNFVESNAGDSLTTEQPFVTQRSFTPTSYKFPIGKIEMFGSNVSGGTVYECPGTTAKDCLVDLADKDAVAALIKEPVAVTYTEGSDPKIVKFEVTVNPGCDTAGTTSFDVMVKGAISVGGTTYYTTGDDNASYLSTDQSKYSAVGVPMSTCGMSWYLPSPVAVDGTAGENGGTASGEVTVSLFVTVKDAAWANPASTNNNPSCVSKSNGAGSFVCASMAVPYPYVGTASPTVESYKITEANNGNLAVVHVARSGSEALGAFTRPYFDGTAIGASSCKAGSWLKSLDKNSDGSFKFTIALGDDLSFDLFDAFKMANHSGTCRDTNGSTYEYAATKL